VNPLNYTLITNIATNRFGGVALLVHNSFQHTQHIINEDLEAIAAKTESKRTIIIYSIYIAPNKTFSRNNLNNVINTNNQTIVVTGDFNGWHPQLVITTHKHKRQNNLQIHKTIASYTPK